VIVCVDRLYLVPVILLVSRQGYRIETQIKDPNTLSIDNCCADSTQFNRSQNWSHSLVPRLSTSREIFASAGAGRVTPATQLLIWAPLTAHAFKAPRDPCPPSTMPTIPGSSRAPNSTPLL
jgi:hypothetical protein